MESSHETAAAITTFQDPQYVYLAMEYVPGGDFRTLLNSSGVLKEEHARFNISEMFHGVTNPAIFTRS